jgi:tetratricopeptide (TPR) repeat protein
MIRTIKVILVSLLLFAGAGCKSIEGTSQKKSETPAQLTEAEYRAYQTAFMDASKEKILGNLNDAERLFQKALTINPRSDAAMFDLAKIAVERGRLGEAATLLEQSREIDPENPWYREYLAQVYAESGRLDEAIETVRSIIELQPDKHDYYFNLGSLLSAQGKFDEALKVYDDLEEQFGLMEEIAMQRQMIYLEQGKADLALEEANKLIDINPEEIRYYGMKAEILEQTGRNEEAKVLYAEMLEIDPDNGLVLLALFEIAEQEGKSAQAREYLASAFRSEDLGIDVKVNILLNLMSNPGESPDYLFQLSDELVAAHSNNAKAYAIQGDLYNNFNRQEEARSKFQKAVEIDPNRPPIWQEILIISSTLNDFETMRTESEKALEYFPQQPIFYLFHGISLQQLGETKEAIDALESGKNLVIDNNELLGQFYASLGDAHHSINDHKASDAAYEKALKYTPSNVIVLNNYAYYLSLREENLERAETMARKANDLSPNQVSFQDTYAWVLFKRGNYQNALFWIKEALKNGGDEDPDVLEHHGDILWQLNEKENAKIAWQMALDLGGDANQLNEKIAREE